MGLSSSQGRLLMLTSRLSDIELQETMISHRQNQIAWQSQEAAQVYNEAISNYKLQIKVTDANESAGYRSEDLNYENMTQMGYLATTADGAIYLKKEIKKTPEQELLALYDKLASLTTDEEKAAVQTEIDNKTNTLNADHTDTTTQSNAQILKDLYAQLSAATTDEAKAEIQAQIDAKREEINKQEGTSEWIIPNNLAGEPLLTINPETGKATIGGKEYPILDGTAYLNNKNITQNLIMNGMMFLHDTTKNTEGISLDLLASDTEIEYVLDTSDDAEAQSKYEYETASLARKDNQLDLELKQLETQHEAVLKEYDSVKEVISNNIDRTFKLFSNG